MLDVHRLIVVFVLGIIEGLTEFLPISSTGHIILINNLLNSTHFIDNIFIIIVQLGAVFSIVLVFRHKLYRMSVVCIINLFTKRHYQYSHLCFLHVLIGTCPGIMLGVLFFEKIRSIFDLLHVVYGLVIGGIFLLIADRCLSHKVLLRISHIDDMTFLQAFLIGCFQCLAFFPGFSRAGATIGGGLLVGLNRRTSLEFSFFLAIPIICGAAILTLYYCRSYISMIDSLFLLIGCCITFCVAIFTIRFFLKIVQSISFIPFVIYRFILAGGIYCFLVI